MKYLVTIIGVICLLACSSEETTRTAETTSQLRPIAFGDAYTVKPTRSSTIFTADKGIPLGQSMGIYAYLGIAEAIMRLIIALLLAFIFSSLSAIPDQNS